MRSGGRRGTADRCEHRQAAEAFAEGLMLAIRSGSSGIKQTANASVDPAKGGHDEV
jgi:hypothetical protein